MSASPRTWLGRTLGSRNPHIDFLRGLAVLVVMYTHFGVCAPFSKSLLLGANLSAKLSRNGYYGVSVFFVVSGFVITSTSLRRFGTLRQVRVGEFYVFRVSRLLFPLLVLVALNVGCLQAGVPAFQMTAGISLPRLLASVFTLRFNLLYLHGGALLQPWAPLWSLAIEEVFYLMFPWLGRIFRRAWAWGLLLGLCVSFGPFYRAWIGPDAGYLYPGCFDGLALGCLTAWVAARWRTPLAHQALGPSLRVLGLAGLAVVYFSADVRVAPAAIFGPPLMGAAATVYLLGSVGAPEPSPLFQHFLPTVLLAGAVELMGYLSYELYLFHLPAFLLATPGWQRLARALGGFFPRDLAFVASAGVLTLVSLGLSRGLHEPARRYFRALLSRGARADLSSPRSH